MPASTEALISAGHEWTVPATNSASGAFTCPKAAVAGQRHYARGISVSCLGTPAAFTVQLKSGNTLLDEFNFSANAFLPWVVNFPNAFEGIEGQDLTLYVPAGIGAFKVSARLSGFSRRG